MTRRPHPGKPKPGRPSRSESSRTASPDHRRQEHFAPQALLSFYRPDLSRALADAGTPQYRSAQVLEHLLQRPLCPFAEASALPLELRASLDALGSAVLWPVATRTAPDGTTKLLLAARDGAEIETVVMPYGNRVTACLSSQVGCAVGCVFCATGTMGFKRNLSTAEIVDQLRAAAVAASSAGRRISNVVYMGMGEPLLNLGAVLDSIRLLTDPLGLHMGHRSLSVSSVGIPAGIVRLGRAEPQINLALSLHAADDATRSLLIPHRYRHPLTDILEAAWEHFAMTRRKLLVEYVLLAGINDSPEDAERLAGLLRGHVVAVNLLAWNPTWPEACPAGSASRHHRHGRGGAAAGLHEKPRRAHSDLQTLKVLSPPAFRPSPPVAVAAFRDVLRRARVEAVVRQSKGAGIEAACGQLAARRVSYA